MFNVKDTAFQIKLHVDIFSILGFKRGEQNMAYDIAILNVSHTNFSHVRVNKKLEHFIHFEM